MNQNHFSKKMAAKTDAGLEAIVADKKNFVDDARQAAIWELENRKGKTDTLIKAEEELEETKALREDQFKDQGDFPDFDDDIILDSTATNSPKLYSKKVILIFSILFSTIVGALLLAMNSYTLKNKNGIFISLLCGVGFVCVMIVVLALIPQIANASILLNIAGGAVMSEAVWNAIIGKNTKYRTRNFVIPLIVSLLISFLIGLALFYGNL